MMRQRLLHPGFFKDAKLLALSPLHRILFEGLWCCADREAKLEDNPIEIKIQVLALDNCDVDAMLADLDRAGMIVRYEVDGRRLILVRNFPKYQHPHPRELESSLPGPQAPKKTRKRVRDNSTPKSGQAMPVPSGSSGSSNTGSSETVTDQDLPPVVPPLPSGGPDPKERAAQILDLDLERLLKNPPKRLTRRQRRMLEQIATEAEPSEPAPAIPDTPAGRVWGSLLERLERGGKKYAVSWLARCVPADLVDGMLELRCPDQFFLSWAEEHYGALIASELPRDVERFRFTAPALEAAR